jgi:hypothetical protein
MIWLVVVLVVVGLPLVALLFGADSRDGRDWQPLRGLPNSSLDTDWPSPHMADADGTNKVVPRRERVKQG